MCGVWPRFRGRGRVSSVPASGPLAVRVHPSGRQADRRVGSQWRWLQAQPDPRAQSAVSALRTRPVSPGSASGGSSPPEEASLRQLQTSRLGWEHPRLPLPPAARRRAGHGVGLVGGSSHQASAPLREATPFSPSTRPRVAEKGTVLWMGPRIGSQGKLRDMSARSSPQSKGNPTPSSVSLPLSLTLVRLTHGGARRHW